MSNQNEIISDALPDKPEYRGNDNYGNPKSEFLNKIMALPEDELFKETKDKIWLSAYASNNHRSDYHWQCDACYDECKRRGKVDEIYSRAHKQFTADL